MKTKNEFEQYADKRAAAEEHQQEIQQSRIGGLGGSDADILLRIGRNGLQALSSTDTKRLAIMMGMAEQEQWGGNDYTRAGHDFEDFIEKTAPLGKDVEREKLMSAKMARNFKTFAHADFVSHSNGQCVYECKYVQNDTESVAKEYKAQLQWYYILGASQVILMHGQGSIPFDESKLECNAMEIERNTELCELILAGVKTLDKAIADGWKPVAPEKCPLEETSVTVQNAFTKLQSISVQKKQMDAEEAEAKAIIESYMNDFECSSIYDDFGNMVVMTKASTSRTFDSAKLLKAHPEFNTDEFYKTSNRKASISYKPGKNQE